MDLEKIRKYLLSKPETTEELPFGPQALVFKVTGTLTGDQVTELIDHSYDLVVKKLKKSDRDRILNINKITKFKLQITNK